MKKTVLALIGFYRRFISPLKPATCRFTPTCSQYAYLAVEEYGVLKGLWLAAGRVCRCHPFHPGGYDPLEKNEREAV